MTSVPRALSVLTKVVGGSLVLVLIAYLTVNLVSLARGWQQRGDLADELATQAEPLLPDLRAGQQEAAEAVGREPDRAWIEQVCAFAHDDSGWMVNNYREQCGLRAVSAWQVASADEGRGLLRVTPREYTVTNPSCEDVGTMEGGEVDVAIAVAGRSADEDCVPGPGHGTEYRTIEGNAGRVAADATWLLVVESTDDLVDADIGCAHWSVLFCDNPFTDHAWADLEG